MLRVNDVSNKYGNIPFAFQAATVLPARFAAHILMCMLRCKPSQALCRNLKCFGYIKLQMIRWIHISFFLFLVAYARPCIT